MAQDIAMSRPRPIAQQAGIGATDRQTGARLISYQTVPRSDNLRGDNDLVFAPRAVSKLVRGYGLKQDFITPRSAWVSNRLRPKFFPSQHIGKIQRSVRSLKEHWVQSHRFDIRQDANRAIGDWIQFHNHPRHYICQPNEGCRGPICILVNASYDGSMAQPSHDLDDQDHLRSGPQAA